MGELIGFELSFAFNSVLMGLKIIIAYDLLRVIRIFIKHGVIIENIEDFIFANISGLFVFGMIYSSNNGAVRGFSLFLVAFTIWAYNMSVSRIVINWLRKAFKTFRKALQKRAKAFRMRYKETKVRKDFVHGEKKKRLPGKKRNQKKGPP